MWLHVTGYSLGCVLRSKHDHSQCSLAPDYGYKRCRGALRAYTQPERIGYLVGTVSRGRSNFVNFWTKIWPAEQPRTTNDCLDWQFLTYSRARQRVFFGSVVRFLRTNLLSSKTIHTLQLFTSVKLQKPTIFFLNGSIRPCTLSIIQYIGNQIHRHWTLFLVQRKDTR